MNLGSVFSSLPFVPEKQNKAWLLSRTKSTDSALLSLGNGDSFIMVCFYKKGLIVESHFIVEINDLFTEIVTLQFYKADIILLRTKYQNSDCLNAVYSKKRNLQQSLD